MDHGHLLPAQLEPERDAIEQEARVQRRGTVRREGWDEPGLGPSRAGRLADDDQRSAHRGSVAPARAPDANESFTFRACAVHGEFGNYHFEVPKEQR